TTQLPTDSRSRAQSVSDSAWRSSSTDSGLSLIPRLGLALRTDSGSSMSSCSVQSAGQKSSCGSIDHSKYANLPGLSDRARVRTREITSHGARVLSGADVVYQTCGFGAVPSVGTNAAIPASVRLYASSRMIVS